VFTTADGHIHELSISRGVSWSHADLTQITAAPPASASYNVSGYSWDSGQSKQVVFRTEDAHIHELSIAEGTNWSHADLTQITGAPLAPDHQDIVGYEWDGDSSKQVVFRTADGHVHELFISLVGQWSHNDLTQISGAPPVSQAYNISGYDWNSGLTKQVVFGTDDGHVHELFFLRQGAQLGPWQHADLTQLTGAPLGNFADGFGWRAAKSKQVVLRTADGHIHELSVVLGGAGWVEADLTEIAGAPASVMGFNIDGYSFESLQSKQVVYVTSDRHIHELSVQLGGAGWVDADLTQITGAPLVMPIGGMVQPDAVNAWTDWAGIHVCLSHDAAQGISGAAGVASQILGVVGGILHAVPILPWILAGLAAYFGVSAALIQAVDKGKGVCLLLTWIQIGFGDPLHWIPTSR
jgi:hypothetical protein